MADIGAYANLKKLEDQLSEMDITTPDATERCRNAPVLDEATLAGLKRSAPEKIEAALLSSEPE
jgi:hypothetical protein